MNVQSKIKLLIESTLSQEQRYLLKMDDSTFEKMPPKTGTDFRQDWYFSGYRIRRITQKGKTQWQRIGENQATKVTKKKTTIPPGDTNKLNKESLLYYKVISKRPIIGGIECYLEKVILPNSSFYTTETESAQDIKNIKLLKKIATVKKLGPISLKEIAKNQNKR